MSTGGWIFLGAVLDCPLPALLVEADPLALAA